MDAGRGFDQIAVRSLKKKLRNICPRAAIAILAAWFPAIAQQLIPAAEAAVADPPPSLYYRDSGERFRAYLSRTYTDPSNLAWLLIDSGMDHWNRAPHQWDRSSQSYSMRVASGWGRRIVRNTTQYGFE